MHINYITIISIKAATLTFILPALDVIIYFEITLYSKIMDWIIIFDFVTL